MLGQIIVTLTFTDRYMWLLGCKNLPVITMWGEGAVYLYVTISSETVCQYQLHESLCL